MLSIVNLTMFALLIFGALALSSSGSAVGHNADRDESNPVKRTQDRT